MRKKNLSLSTTTKKSSVSFYQKVNMLWFVIYIIYSV